MKPLLKSRRQSLRIIFAAAVAAMLIPVLSVGGWFAQGWAKAERGRIEQDIVQKTREIASNVDREITAATAMLSALASSPSLRTRDFDAFYRQASAVARKLNTQIVLLDPRAGQIVNTAAPWGAPLPNGESFQVVEASRQALATGEPVVSNVFVGPLIKRAVVSVGVPAADDAGTVYYLAVGLPTDHLAALLQRTTIGLNWIAAIVDRNDVFVSRSQDHAAFTGTRITRDPAPAGLREGVLKTINRDGSPFYWFFYRTDLTGWAVGVGIPAAVLEAPLKRASVDYAVASGLVLMAAVGLSYGFGARLTGLFGTLGIDRQPTRAEFRVLFDCAPNGVALVNREGIILLTNRWMVQTFGYDKDELIGKPVELLVPERLRPGAAVLRQTLANAPTTRAVGGDGKLYGRRKDGSEFPIELNLNSIDAERGNLVLATITDISARKQLSAAELALHASEEQLRLAIEAAELGPWSWDLVTGNMWWSDRMRQMLGVPDSIPASHPIWNDRVHPSDRHLIQEIFRRRLSGERYHDYEYRITRLDDGAVRYLSSKGQTTFDESGKPVSVLGVVQDITLRKSAEAARDDLRRALMHAQEQERLRLAQELHDEAGQSLAAVQMQLKRIAINAGARERTDIGALQSQLEQMGAALHRISFELRPAAIDELGLTTVLANYLSEWSLHFCVPADFHCRDPKLDQLVDDVRTTIYRITQEALTNIGKHAAAASSVSVVIDREGGEIRLIVEDNGSGFDTAAPGARDASRPGALGLAGMRERLAVLGGSLEVESSSEGTTIFARIPVEPGQASARTLPGSRWAWTPRRDR